MNIQSSIGKKLILGFGLGLVLLLIVGAVSFWSLIALVDNTYMVTHTHLVLEDLENILSLMKDMETGRAAFS